MTNNYRFSKEDIEKANNVDLAEFLMSRGEDIKRSGSEYVWTNNPEKITMKGNLWYNHYTLKGGNAISFVKEYMNVEFPEAVSILLGETNSQFQEQKVQPKNREPVFIPSRNESMNRVNSYLTNVRGISKDVLDVFISKGLIYEEEKYHNVVFVGKDKGENIRHVHMRGSGYGTGFKMTTFGSDPHFSFHWYGTDDELYLFEAPIDLLSYITMNPNSWQDHSYAAACSVSDKVLHQMIHDNPNIKRIHICFDNDTPGHSAASRIIDGFDGKGIEINRLVSKCKDWNEDLTLTNDYEEFENLLYN